MDLADLILELFEASQDAEPGRGHAFERAVANQLHEKGIPLESVPGGARLFGFGSASGLAHQLDVVAALDSADVIIELKARASATPKNDLLRFKAATDDYFMALSCEPPTRPIYRVFTMLGIASRSMRRYAAIHGIAMVERDRWPSTVLASDRLWIPGNDDLPAAMDRRALRRLVGPVHVADGSSLTAIRHPGSRITLDAVLNLQDEWSVRLWAAVERRADGAPISGGMAA